MAPFKDEHILLLAPGSQITQAQLGLPESFTPARFCFPTRMFPAEKKGEWEPYRVREKSITVKRRVPKPPPSLGPGNENGNESENENGQQHQHGQPEHEVGDSNEDAESKTKVKGEKEGAGDSDEKGKGQEETSRDTEKIGDEDVEMKDVPESETEKKVTITGEDEKKKEEEEKAAKDSISKSTGEQSPAQTLQPELQTETTSTTAVTKRDAETRNEAPEQHQPQPPTAEPEYNEIEELQTVFQEDPSSEEGAVFPIRNGAIVNWPCFFALLTHIYNTLSPPFHTPIIMIAQPCWTLRDREIITQFIFEKFKTPAFCLMDSALAVCFAYGVTTATVIDVGHGKVDVTAVIDSVVSEHGRGIALEGCGGDAMTERLFELLQDKGFSKEMCEQLKRSNICEILSADIPIPGSTNTVALRTDEGSEVSKIIGKEQQTSHPQHHQQVATAAAPPLPATEEDDDGVLNVAAIVTGNTSEILAQKEREKAERLAAKKGTAAEAAAKALRLPNAKKETNTFHYSSYVPVKNDNGVGEHYILTTKEIEVGQERFKVLTPSESKSPNALMFGILETIATQVHHTITSVPEMHRRGELWDSIIIVGNGSKIKGFSQALLSTITHHYLLTPSPGTIFTTDLPSSIPTPTATGGTNTPANMNTPNPYLVAATSATNNPTSVTVNPNDPNQPRGPSASQTPLSVKTLKPPEYFPEFKGGLGAAIAATSAAMPGNTKTTGQTGAASGTAGGVINSGSGHTANAAAIGAAGAGAGVPGQSHNAGFEEAMFLGAQVAAKIVFLLDQGMSKGFLSRVEYNELGPAGIHECGL
ncbi:Actin-like protein arp9 (SWI/SNF complex component arp9) [Ascosphaera aggregata]|nr:Actin-like protein arp9 (SWI/SNF complex component arp9) [Ascosphaera aggregata]